MDLADSLGVLNSSIQFAAGQVGNVKDKKWIAKENQKSRDFQLEMWNRANDYNLPQNVMYRYKMAGLNPNLIYDNGTNAQAAYMSAPGHSAPNMGSQNLGRYLNILQDIALKSQIDVNKTQAEKNEADAYKATAEGRSAYVRANVDEANEENYNKQVKESLELLVQQGKLTKNEADKALIAYKDASETYDARKKLNIPSPDFGGEEGYEDYNYGPVILEDGKYATHLVNWYEAQNDLLRMSLYKAGLDASQVGAVIGNIKSSTAVNYAEVALKQTQRGYYTSLSHLNNELAKTEGSKRAEIASRIAVNNKTLDVLQSQYYLNYAQAKSVLDQLEIAVKTNNMEGFKNFVTNQFGNNSTIWQFGANLINMEMYKVTNGKGVLGIGDNTQEYQWTPIPENK